ncbi:hypothetical protein EGM51_04475 [Verrucomicrobia bacterium S94]|nr:hypothetical protein EGM51_04475 [Verrucomicrobia bacterium S94]
MASVGHELLAVPLPEMVMKLGLGIAEAQRALDENSVETAQLLADTEVPLVMAVTQTINADGSVEFTNADPVDVSLLQVGLMPTFYQFSEATIEVTMDIKTTTSRETNVDVSAKAKVGFGCWSASVSVDVSHNRKFGKEVHGTSRLVTKMTPVPPPPRLEPELILVDNRPADNSE